MDDVFPGVALANVDGTVRTMRQGSDITPKRETIPRRNRGGPSSTPRVKSSKRGRGRPSHPYANARARINTIQLFSFLLSLSRHYSLATRSNSAANHSRSTAKRRSNGQIIFIFFSPYFILFLSPFNRLV